MARNFYLKNDAEFLAGSQNFSSRITATPTVYGLTAAQAAEYATLSEDYGLAYSKATDPNLWTPAIVAQKRIAKKAAKELAKNLAAIIRSTATVTDAQLVELGLKPRPHRQPRPIPDFAPGMQIISVLNWTVTGRLWDTQEPERRGKPPLVDGAAIVSYVGEEPPTNAAAWKLEGLVSRTVFKVTFPDTLEAGTKVWISAYWFNERKQSGPACPPQSVNLQAGGLANAA